MPHETPHRTTPVSDVDCFGDHLRLGADAGDGGGVDGRHADRHLFCRPRTEALTDANAQQMAEGGWNLVWANSLAELDVAQAHGLRAMWTGSLDDATVNSIRNHPALYAYYVTDEPSASQFAGLAATVSRLRTLDPNHMAYINLFPTYAS